MHPHGGSAVRAGTRTRAARPLRVPVAT